MPNHVTHRLVVTGPAETIAAFTERCFVAIDGETTFDFNTLIPMPEALLKAEAGSNADLGLVALDRDDLIGNQFINGLATYLTYPWIKEKGITDRESLRAYVERERPEALVEAFRAIENHKLYGSINWYEWSLTHWNTKWNAYSFSIVSQEPERLEFLFDTAWAPPEPIFDAIAVAFPDIVVEGHFYDEGSNFAGFVTIDSGESDTYLGDATDELYELVYGEAPERYDEDDDVNA